MSDRALPTVDGAPACPFVAFDDDRDARSLAPDHRHRCFAEPRPATRALAHQEAYCLSSAFPVCPTFQDWARREAAIARAAAAQPAPDRAEPPVGATPPGMDAMPAPPPERYAPPPPPAGSGTPVPPATPDAPRRSSQRDWAAPPPWLAEAEDAAPDDGSLYGGDPYDDLPPIDEAGYPEEDDHGRFPAPAPVEPPSFLAAKAATPADPSRGLAGSPADRFAGGDPYAPQPASPASPPDPSGAADDDLDDWAGPGTAAVAAATARPSSSGRQRYEAQRVGPGRESQAPPRTPMPSPGRAPTGRKGKQPDPEDLFGPAWEPARRYEAYPSLRTRIGLPRIGGVPPLGLAVLALVGAAAFLFFVGPMLLGIGGNDSGATPAPVATEEITLEPEPTLPPEPTPQVYTIKKGDTISSIARKFGVTTEELLAANPKIKNPDKIKIGQEITIPVPAAEEIVDETVDDGTVEDSAQP
jgi:hypothetical protein